MTMFPKPGIVRLYGEDMNQLRRDCLERDGPHCVKCGRRVRTGPDVPDYAPDKYDMAHKRPKRLYGDTLANVQVECHECHMREHTEGKDA